MPTRQAPAICCGYGRQGYADWQQESQEKGKGRRPWRWLWKRTKLQRRCCGNSVGRHRQIESRCCPQSLDDIDRSNQDAAHSHVSVFKFNYDSISAVSDALANCRSWWHDADYPTEGSTDTVCHILTAIKRDNIISLATIHEGLVAAALNTVNKIDLTVKYAASATCILPVCS